MLNRKKHKLQNTTFKWLIQKQKSTMDVGSMTRTIAFVKFFYKM